MFTLLQFVLLFPIFTYVSTEEPLCAELEVHKQKWIGGAGARQLGEAERAVDLQECLRRCCANTDCSAVSFSGFLVGPTPSPTSANCALFQCAGDGECPVVDGSALADEGLLSVRLRRKQASTTIATTTTILIAPTLTASPASSTSPSAGEKPDEDNELRPTWPSPKNGLGQVLPLEEEEDVTAKDNETTRASLFNLDTWDERFPLRADTTPVWAIGLAIVATIVCLGWENKNKHELYTVCINSLLLTLLCTFLCHRRYRQAASPNENEHGDQRPEEDAHTARVQPHLKEYMQNEENTTRKYGSIVEDEKTCRGDNRQNISPFCCDYFASSLR